MRVPYFIQGAIFAPALIGVTIVLKSLCPAGTEAACFADYLSVPIFLPLVFASEVLAESVLRHNEFWFVLVYWIIVGLLIGLIFDLRNRQSRY